MRISGSGGRLHVGYQPAARLGAWTLTRVRTGPTPAYEATAQVTEFDTFWAEQRPMDLELEMGQRIWHWKAVEPRLSSESLAVTLDGGPSIH